VDAPLTLVPAGLPAGVTVHPSWAGVVGGEATKPYWKALWEFVRAARSRGAVYPPSGLEFTALALTPLDSVRVVILGQDPYHGPGQAHGLAFSVARGVATPPSLRNMITEAEADVGIRRPTHGNLEAWARQGVLLLNAVLTVDAGKPNSHAAAGWEMFTSAIIQEVSRRRKGVVFLLWGKPAQVKARMVDRARHHVLEAPHPSPLSAHRGFFGCRHFSQTNALLKGAGDTPIDWALDP